CCKQHGQISASRSTHQEKCVLCCEKSRCQLFSFSDHFAWSMQIIQPWKLRQIQWQNGFKKGTSFIRKQRSIFMSRYMEGNRVLRLKCNEFLQNRDVKMFHSS